MLGPAAGVRTVVVALAGVDMCRYSLKLHLAILATFFVANSSFVMYVYQIEVRKIIKTIENKSAPPETALSCGEPLGREQSSNHAGSLGGALDLLWAAESSRGRQMVGDGGLAKGHFQQHRGHWKDGIEALNVNWPYSDTNNLARAAAVAAANWSRYAPKALASGDTERLIRSHRLPCDPYRPDNQDYVERVLNTEKGE